MPEAPNAKDRLPSVDPPWLPTVDKLLIEGIRRPALKHAAVDKVLQLVPEWTRGDCWRRIRQLRRLPEVAALLPKPTTTEEALRAKPASRSGSRPWTQADDDRLLNLAGYETVEKIAQRLARTESAVRYRMSSLGMSARVSDGWTLRRLQSTLRMSRTRLRYLIGKGWLRVRDSRVNAESLASYCERRQDTLSVDTREKLLTLHGRGEEGYPWPRAAELLGMTVEQIQELIGKGELQVLDMFVTDRSFEEFCKKHGSEINSSLMDRADARWLIEEYGVPDSAAKGRVAGRAQKHALIIRTCKCGKKIAGNVFFRHFKRCTVVLSGASLRKAV
jgi:hypothetical protein